MKINNPTLEVYHPIMILPKEYESFGKMSFSEPEKPCRGYKKLKPLEKIKGCSKCGCIRSSKFQRCPLCIFVKDFNKAFK